MNEFRQLLDLNIRNILNLLPREFSISNFINAMRDVLNNEYARVLTTAGHSSYRTLHTWVARWYLYGLAERGLIIKANNKLLIITRNGNKSQNQLWRKLE